MAQSNRATFRTTVSTASLLAGMILYILPQSTTYAIPVLPSAVGFGVETAAGRAGTVYKVTNLGDTGAGSLRACIEASGPRVCVFEVSGVIRWADKVVVRNPYLTIAGQTAPSPGVLVRGSALFINASDVLIQHMTFRVGDDLDGSSAYSRDSLSINVWDQKATNVVIDHCSFSWNTDEAMGVFHGLGDITIANSIVAEGLNYSPVLDNGGYGVLMGPNAGARISMIGNLLAHNVERNPMVLSGQFAFVNNVIYNWPKDATRIANQSDPQLGGDVVRTKTSFVGNLYIRGPNYRVIPGAQSRPIWFDGTVASTGNQAYLFDNAEILKTSDAVLPPSDQWTLAAISSPNSRSSLEVKSAPSWPTGLTAKPVGSVKASVLASAGARPADRSAKDAEIISEVQSGTGSYVSCVNPSSYYSASAGYISANVVNCDSRNAGGWPVYAKNYRALTLPSDPSGDADGDGYTNLEEWLHEMAAKVESSDANVKPSPPGSVAAQ